MTTKCNVCPRWDHRTEKGHQVKSKEILVIIFQYLNISSQPVAYLKFTGLYVYTLYMNIPCYISQFLKRLRGKLIFINLYISRKNSFCEKAFWNEIGKLECYFKRQYATADEFFKLKNHLLYNHSITLA